MAEEPRVAGIVDSWRDQLAKGQTVAPRAQIASHPDLAAELRARFEALARTYPSGDGHEVAALRTLPRGRYREFRPAGEGGMGIVYWAVDTDLNREVAFKVIRAEPGEGEASAPDRPMELKPPAEGTAASLSFRISAQRFLQEAWITSGMAHPGIVPVYELGQTAEGIPYYTMRFVRGERTLATALQEAEGAHLEERLALLEPFLKVCDTLRYAHACGVIHRDLKPTNIALGDFGEVVLLDWGLAKVEGVADADGENRLQAHIRLFREATDLQTVAAAMGTPGYMSPEAAFARSASTDERSDVYSLGAILFEILTGRLPFLYECYGELATLLMSKDPPRASEFDDLIPEALSDLRAACLARQPDERPRNADEVATAIRQWQVERERDREVESLFRDARSALAAAEESSGALRVRHLDRAVAACGRIFVRRPDHARALVLQRSVKRLREQGIREREREAHSRLLKRVAALGLVFATIATVLVAVLLEGRRKEAEAAHEREAVQRARAEDLAIFMLGDLRDELTPVGRLDVLKKVAHKAIAYYESVPPDLLTVSDRRARGLGLRNIGEVLLDTGDHTLAQGVLEDARRIFAALLREDPSEGQRQRDLTVVLNLLGDVLQERGDLPLAQSRYEEALAIRRRLLDASNAEPMGHDDVARTLDRLGDVFSRRGDRASALRYYQESFEIRRSLAKAAPDDDRWKRALASSLQKIGDTQVKTGSMATALESYEAALEIWEGLLGEDPAHSGHAEDVAACAYRIAYVLNATGASDLALARYEEVLTTYRRLGARDPSHAWWQRNIALTLERVADLRKQMGDEATAGAHYVESLAIKRDLSARDPSNARARHDVAVAHVNVGDFARDAGDRGEAIENYRRALDLSRALTAQAPDDPEWMDDLATAHARLASVLLSQGNEKAAEATYREATSTARRTLEKDPNNVDYRRNLSLHLSRLGDLQRDRGDLEGAATRYLEARRIRKSLTERDPDRQEWQKEYVAILNRSSDVAQRTGDRETSLACHLDAERINRRLLEQQPDDVDRLHELAFSLYGVGIGYEAAGRLAEALKALREGLDAHRRCAALSVLHREEHHFWTEAYERVVFAMGAEGIETAGDHLTLAYMWQARERHGRAVDRFRVALDDSGLRADLEGSHLYHAACSAALAKRPLQALHWLGEDLELRRQALLDIQARLAGSIGSEEAANLREWATALGAHLRQAREGDPALESLRDHSGFTALFD